MSDRSTYKVEVNEISGELTLKVSVNFTTTSNSIEELYQSAMDRFWEGDSDLVHSELTHWEVTDSWDDYEEIG
jgi:hypothetical protein